jgi:hypothetical protein
VAETSRSWSPKGEGLMPALLHPGVYVMGIPSGSFHRRGSKPPSAFPIWVMRLKEKHNIIVPHAVLRIFTQKNRSSRPR